MGNKTVYYCETNGDDLIISVTAGGEVHYITDELLDELDIFDLSSKERAAYVFKFLSEDGDDDHWNNANEEGITLESLLDGVTVVTTAELTYWNIEYHTGAGNREFYGELEFALKAADDGICYTQQPVTVSNSNVTYQRDWWGIAYDGESESSPICFGDFGYYSDWERM